MNKLKTTDWYTSKGWFLWYVDNISINLVLKNLVLNAYYVPDTVPDSEGTADGFCLHVDCSLGEIKNTSKKTHVYL